MSELKVYSQCYDGTDGLFYLKSEADKVIADLEESHKKEVEQLLIEIVKLNEDAQNLILDNYSKDNKFNFSWSSSPGKNTTPAIRTRRFS